MKHRRLWRALTYLPWASVVVIAVIASFVLGAHRPWWAYVGLTMFSFAFGLIGGHITATLQIRLCRKQMEHFQQWIEEVT